MPQRDLINTLVSNTEQQARNTTKKISPRYNENFPEPLTAPDERLCAICHGCGYIIQEPPPGKYQAKTILCPVRCNGTDNLARLRDISQIKKGQLNWRLTGSNMHKLIRPAIAELVQIINSDEPAAFWYIHGPNGIGKSYILIAAINEGMLIQRSGLYTTTTKMLDALRNTHSDVAAFGTEYDLLENVRKSTILAIDEVGRERSTEYAEEKLFDIYNSRYQDAHVYGSNNEAKITLLAGNYPPDELEPYLQSRLQDKNGRVIDMSTKDAEGNYIHPDRRTVE